eukprot:m.116582 g.116582  ORF g.116582 m.116582 type:complete len:373 (+) comp23048_c0_seq3:39-1157(+)
MERNLERSKVTDERVPIILAEIQTTPTPCHSLILTGNAITDDGSRSLASFLQSNPTLKSLALGFNKLTPTGISIVADALHQNTNLQVLDFTMNSVQDTGAEALADCLSHNKALKKLILYKTSISDDGIQALATTLVEANDTLTYLDVGSNRFGENGLSILALVLATSSTLESLSLRNNDIRAAEAEELAEAMMANSNSALKTLDLRANKLLDRGARHMARALSHDNCHLRCLDLQRNMITGQGCGALAEALETNTDLCSINLDDNKLIEEDVQTLQIISAHVQSNLLAELQKEESEPKTADAGSQTTLNSVDVAVQSRPEEVSVPLVVEPPRTSPEHDNIVKQAPTSLASFSLLLAFAAGVVVGVSFTKKWK